MRQIQIRPEEIQRIRKEMKLTQRELARMLNVGYETMRAYEVRLDSTRSRLMSPEIHARLLRRYSLWQERNKNAD